MEDLIRWQVRCSAVIEATGGNYAEAQALLRHKSMKTTVDVYKKQITPQAFKDGMKLLQEAANRTSSLRTSASLKRSPEPMNNHDGDFREEGIMRGVALSGDSMEQAGMGMGIGDYNLDGHLDIFKTPTLAHSPSANSGNCAKWLCRNRRHRLPA